MSQKNVILVHGYANRINKNKNVYLSLNFDLVKKEFFLEIYSSVEKTKERFSNAVTFEDCLDDLFDENSASLKNVQTQVESDSKSEVKSRVSLEKLLHVQHLSRGFKTSKSDSIFKRFLRNKPNITETTQSPKAEMEPGGEILTNIGNPNIPLEVLPNRSVLGIWLTDYAGLIFRYASPTEATKWANALQKIIHHNQKTKNYPVLEFAWQVEKFKFNSESPETTSLDSFDDLYRSIKMKDLHKTKDKKKSSSQSNNVPLYFSLQKNGIIFIKGDPTDQVFQVQYPFIRNIGYDYHSLFELTLGRAANIGACTIVLKLKNINETKFAYFQCEYLMEKRSKAFSLASTSNRRSNSNSLSSENASKERFSSHCNFSNSNFPIIKRQLNSANDRLSQRLDKTRNSEVIRPSLYFTESSRKLNSSFQSFDNSGRSQNKNNENNETADTLLPMNVDLGSAEAYAQDKTLTEEYVCVDKTDQKLSCEDMIGSSDMSLLNMETMLWIANLEKENISRKEAKTMTPFDSLFHGHSLSNSCYRSDFVSLNRLNTNLDVTSSSGIGTNSLNSSSQSSYLDEENQKNKKEVENIPDPQTVIKVLNYLKKTVENQEQSSNMNQNSVLNDLKSLTKHPMIENILSQMIESTDVRKEKDPEKLIDLLYPTKARRTIASCYDRSEIDKLKNRIPLNYASGQQSSKGDTAQITQDSNKPLPRISKNDLFKIIPRSFTLGSVDKQDKYRSENYSRRKEASTFSISKSSVFNRRESLLSTDFPSNRENSKIFAEVSYGKTNPLGPSPNNNNKNYDYSKMTDFYTMKLDEKSFRKRISSDGNNLNLKKLSKMFNQLMNPNIQSNNPFRSSTFSNELSPTSSAMCQPPQTFLSKAQILAPIKTGDKLVIREENEGQRLSSGILFLDDNYSERYYD